MDTIVDGSVVEMHYSLTNDKDELIDTSKERGPLAYTQGQMQIVPGLEKEMAGKKVGDKFKVVVSPEEGYGLKDESMIQAVSKEQFGEEANNIQTGMQFEVSCQNGQRLIVTAVEITENEIVLDGNHPLAGETLHFDIEVVTISATEKSTCNDPSCC